MEKTKALMIAAGQDASALDAGGALLSDAARAALEKDVREKAAKAQEEEAKKRAEQAKRLDYIVRALREAERARAEALGAAIVTDDAAYVSKVRADAIARAAERHAQAMASRARLERMTPHRDAFEAAVLARRKKAAEGELVRVFDDGRRRGRTHSPSSQVDRDGSRAVAGPLWPAMRPHHPSGRSGLTSAGSGPPLWAGCRAPEGRGQHPYRAMRCPIKVRRPPPCLRGPLAAGCPPRPRA